MRIQEFVVLGFFSAALAAPVAQPEPAPAPAPQEVETYGGKYLPITTASHRG